MHKQKFQWTKKKIIGLIVIVLIVLSASIWGAFQLKNSKETSTKIEEKSNKNHQTIRNKEKSNSNSYKNLLGLDYTILRAKNVQVKNDKHTLYLDILVNQPLEEDKLSSLGKETYNIFSKNVTSKDLISSIHLSLFNNKEAFEKTQDAKYEGGYVEGLLQTFISNHENGNKAILNSYETFSLDKNVDSLDASLNFEVVDAETNNTTIDTDIVMENGTINQIQDMVISLSEMIKSSNESTEHVNLNIYNTNNNYQNKNLDFFYSTKNPTVLLMQKQITF